MLRLSLSIGGLLLTAACATQPNPEITQSPGYELGYAAGCTTGQKRQDAFSRALERDEAKYESDEAYRIGWNDGFNSCGGKAGSQDPYADSLDRWESGGPHK